MVQIRKLSAIVCLGMVLWAGQALAETAEELEAQGKQTIVVDGKTMTFAEVRTLPEEKRQEIKPQLTKIQWIRFQSWSLKTTNKEIAEKEARIEAKDKEFIQKAYKYAALVASNRKLLDDPKIINYITKLTHDDVLPQDLILRFKALLKSKSK